MVIKKTNDTDRDRQTGRQRDREREKGEGGGRAKIYQILIVQQFVSISITYLCTGMYNKSRNISIKLHLQQIFVHTKVTFEYKYNILNPRIS